MPRRDVARPRRHGGRPLLQPDRLHLRAALHERVDGRAHLRDAPDPHDPGRDARRASSARRGRCCSPAPCRSWASCSSSPARAASSASNVKGDALALLAVATWAVYTVAVAPLMTRHSPVPDQRLRARDDGAAADASSARSSSQPSTTRRRGRCGRRSRSPSIGPLVVTNVLWFTAIDRVGPSRASLFANLQPFLAAVFGVILLSRDDHAAAGRWAARRSPPRSWSAACRRTRATPPLEGHSRSNEQPARTPRAHAGGLPPLDRTRARDLRGPDGDAAARGARPDDRRDRAAADRLRPRRASRSTPGSSRRTCSPRP